MRVLHRTDKPVIVTCPRCEAIIQYYKNEERSWYRPAEFRLVNLLGVPSRSQLDYRYIPCPCCRKRIITFKAPAPEPKRGLLYRIFHPDQR